LSEFAILRDIHREIGRFATQFLKLYVMLKKKMNELVQKIGPDQESNFEIIRDVEAGQVIGGEACGQLLQCENFTGGCDKLTSCGTFMES
jgi:hypothetical protein